MPENFAPLRKTIRRFGRVLRRATARFACPVCQSGVFRFAPLPAKFSQERKRHGNPYSFDVYETLNYRAYSCPVCFASDRDRLYALFLERKLATLSFTSSFNLLDIAPSAPLQQFLQRFPFVKVRTADLHRDDVDDRVDICRMSMYDQGKFDAFICSHVLEHVPDDRSAMNELRRVLKDEGFGILMVPINLQLTHIDEDPSVTNVSERWRRFGQDDHVRQYSREGFLERAREAGFEVEELGAEWFGLSTFRRHGLTPQSVLYVVRHGGSG